MPERVLVQGQIVGARLMIRFLFFIDKFLFIGPRVLLNFLMPPFSIFERSLIKKVSSQLPAERGILLLEHAKLSNYVQRDLYDRQIRFYKFTPFYYDFKRDNYFHPSSGEINICKFKVSFRNGESLHGSIKAMDGVFTIINFDRNSSSYRNVSDFDVVVK